MIAKKRVRGIKCISEAPGTKKTGFYFQYGDIFITTGRSFFKGYRGSWFLMIFNLNFSTENCPKILFTFNNVKQKFQKVKKWKEILSNISIVYLSVFNNNNKKKKLKKMD